MTISKQKPDGSNAMVRGEIGDSSHTCSQGQLWKMVMSPSLQFDDDLSGDSEAENNSSKWSRNPREGHCRERRNFKRNRDCHGAQFGLGRQICQKPRKTETGGKSSRLKKKKKRHKSEVCIKPSESQHFSIGREILKCVGNKESNEQKKIEEENKNRDTMDKYDMNDNRKSIELIIDDSKKFEDDSKTFAKDKKQKLGCWKPDVSYEKIDKDALNEKYLKQYQYTVEVKTNSHEKMKDGQLEMQKKETARKWDDEDFAKSDSDKDKGTEKNIDYMDFEDKKALVESGDHQEKKSNGPRSSKLVGEAQTNTIDREQGYISEEKLVVNLNQGRYRLADANGDGNVLDNKILYEMEEHEDADQTEKKQVLDPLANDKYEKEDIDKELGGLEKEDNEPCKETDKKSTQLDEQGNKWGEQSKEWVEHDKESDDKSKEWIEHGVLSSFGFEVDGMTSDLLESTEPTIHPFEYTKQALEHEDYESPNSGKYERCHSIEEHSFLFSGDNFSSISSTKSLPLDKGTEFMNFRQSCPDFNRVCCMQDIKHENDLRNRFLQIRVETQTLVHQRILNLDTKSSKEILIENEEKFEEFEKESIKEKMNDDVEEIKDDCWDKQTYDEDKDVDDVIDTQSQVVDIVDVEVDDKEQKVENDSNKDIGNEKDDEDMVDGKDQDLTSTIEEQSASGDVDGSILIEEMQVDESAEQDDVKGDVNESEDTVVEMADLIEDIATDVIKDADNDEDAELMDAEEKDEREKENTAPNDVEDMPEELGGKSCDEIEITENNKQIENENEEDVLKGMEEHQSNSDENKMIEEDKNEKSGNKEEGLDSGDIPDAGSPGGRDDNNKNEDQRSLCLSREQVDKMRKGQRKKKKKSKLKKRGALECKMKSYNNRRQQNWRKMKVLPQPKLPKHQEIDKVAPNKDWSGRRHSIFGYRQYGRRCSANSGGSRGNGAKGDKSDNNSSSNQRNNGDKNGTNRNNHDSNRDNDNNNNNDGNGNHGYNNNNGGLTGGGLIVSRDITDVTTPPPDFKHYRKKHTELSDFEWLDILVQAIEDHDGPVINVFTLLIKGESGCFCKCLELGDLSDEAMQCSVCLTIHSMLQHYANCPMNYNNCKMCVQIFSLFCSHVADCLKNPVNDCSIKICVSIRVSVGNDIQSRLKTLWFQLRKKLARMLDTAEEECVELTNPADDSRPKRPVRLSTSSGPLPSIPEGSPLPTTSTSRSSSRVLSRKKSNLSNVEEQQPSGVGKEGLSSSPALNAEAQDVEMAGEEQEDVDSKHGLQSDQTIYSRSSENQEEADALPTSNDASVESSGSGQFGSGQFIAGGSKYMSLPVGPPGHGETYFPSFKDRPTGKKGIGEVVYADKHQLVVVVKIWDKFKHQYSIETRLAKHYTEEGVILSDFKSKLRIKGLRYQNEFQWVKLTHLGNGMTGKCHLAEDFETSFKFCVKEIHISNYEKEEIELWSGLDHKYIVQVYGAIRHGEKIYILQEFIEGGCLTEAINIQRKLGRRLSQLTALRFFQQLLEVLIYLKSRNILHEDLKADNILLDKTTEGVSIKVADFGLARRCQGQVRGGTKPVGTQTQWSPEKAEARIGYGFGAEVWAAVCVLIHMLSGLPPWMRRYENLKALLVVIVEKSPPEEDIPRNINDLIKDLIKRGFTVCQGQRPSAEQLLTHAAFRLLDEAPVLQSTAGFISMLPSESESQNNCIDDDPNADLREIYRELIADSQTGATGSDENGNNGMKQESRKVSSVNGRSMEQFESSGQNRVSNDQVINRRIRVPSHADDNIDPTSHIENFLYDVHMPLTPPQPQPNLVEYNPHLGMVDGLLGNSRSQESSVDHESSGTITDQIPAFEKILSHDNDIHDVLNNDSDNEDKDENIFKDFDYYKELEQVREIYIPTVINSGTDSNPESRLASEQDSPIQGNFTAGNLNKSENTESAKENPKQLLGISSSQTIKVTTPSDFSSFYSAVEEHFPSINDDDDLFKSGSPPKSTQVGPGYAHTMHGIPEVSEPHLYGNSSRIYPAQQINVTRQQQTGLSPGLPHYSKPSTTQHPVIPHSTSAGSMQNYAHFHVPRDQRHGVGDNHKTNLQYPGSNLGSSAQPNLEQQYHLHYSQSQPYMTLPPENIHVYSPQGQPNVAIAQGHGAITRQTMHNLEVSMHQTHLYDQRQLMSNQGQGYRGQLTTQGQSNWGHPSTQGQGYGGQPSTQGQSHLGHPTTQGQGYRGQPTIQGQSNWDYPGTEGQHHRGQPNTQGQNYMIQGHPLVSSPQLGGYYRSSGRLPHSQFDPNGFQARSELGQEYRFPQTHLNHFGLSSMPNQLGNAHLKSADPNSLNLHNLTTYAAGPLGSEGPHNGARPKVPSAQTRQIYPSQNQTFFGRRREPPIIDKRIHDPRQVYEQTIMGNTGRAVQNHGYPMQPKTYILNPAINPRPAAPLEGQRMDLRLDINRAQQGMETPFLSHAQTAPIFSPPKTPKKSPDLHRTYSQVPVVHKSSSHAGISSSSSMKEDKMSSSTSRSQYEEQDDAFRQLGHTAEEALSQHSDPVTRMFITDYDDDIDEEIKGEIDDSYLENPEESLAHMLDPKSDDSVIITFSSGVNGQNLKMKFFSRHTSKSWEKIIKEELDGFSRVSIKEFGLQRFCLKKQDGNPIDLDSCLGKVNCTVIMAEATDNDPWWIEGGMISK